MYRLQVLMLVFTYLYEVTIHDKIGVVTSQYIMLWTGLEHRFFNP